MRQTRLEIGPNQMRSVLGLGNQMEIQVPYSTCHNYPGGGPFVQKSSGHPPGQRHIWTSNFQPPAKFLQLWMPKIDFGWHKLILDARNRFWNPKSRFWQKKKRLRQLRHLSQSWDPGSWGRFCQNVHPPGRLSRKDESTPRGRFPDFTPRGQLWHAE